MAQAKVRNSSISIVVPLITLLAQACGASQGDLVKAAESESEQGDTISAIQLYRKHIKTRLAVQNRPEWENPYFYELLIADLYLKRGEPLESIAAIDQAELQGVDGNLTSDRYRAVARWYEERGELQNAFELLKKHREKDPLLYDAMLDPVGQKITAQELNNGNIPRNGQ